MTDPCPNCGQQGPHLLPHLGSGEREYNCKPAAATGGEVDIDALERLYAATLAPGTYSHYDGAMKLLLAALRDGAEPLICAYRERDTLRAELVQIERAGFFSQGVAQDCLTALDNAGMGAGMGISGKANSLVAMVKEACRGLKSLNADLDAADGRLTAAQAENAVLREERDRIAGELEVARVECDSTLGKYENACDEVLRARSSVKTLRGECTRLAWEGDDARAEVVTLRRRIEATLAFVEGHGKRAPHQDMYQLRAHIIALLTQDSAWPETEAKSGHVPSIADESVINLAETLRRDPLRGALEIMALRRKVEAARDGLTVLADNIAAHTDGYSRSAAVTQMRSVLALLAEDAPTAPGYASGPMSGGSVTGVPPITSVAPAEDAPTIGIPEEGFAITRLEAERRAAAGRQLVVAHRAEDAPVPGAEAAEPTCPCCDHQHGSQRGQQCLCCDINAPFGGLPKGAKAEPSRCAVDVSSPDPCGNPLPCPAHPATGGVDGFRCVTHGAKRDICTLACTYVSAAKGGGGGA